MATLDPSGAAADTATLPPRSAAGLAERQALPCAPGQKFEMETVEIAGVPTRTWEPVEAPPLAAAG